MPLQLAREWAGNIDPGDSHELLKLVQGDFGRSIFSGRPVAEETVIEETVTQEYGTGEVVIAESLTEAAFGDRPAEDAPSLEATAESSAIPEAPM
ncbi:MAG: hypothetical protein WCL29_08135, partial [Pseudomonadota bacterium]